jgi:hypothetical protein
MSQEATIQERELVNNMNPEGLKASQEGKHTKDLGTTDENESPNTTMRTEMKSGEGDQSAVI